MAGAGVGLQRVSFVERAAMRRAESGKCIVIWDIGEVGELVKGKSVVRDAVYLCIWRFGKTYGCPVP